MIPYNFEYDRPKTLEEAVQIFERQDTGSKMPLYFSGGTEIITLGSINRVYTGAVIDIKSIPECRALAVLDDKLVLGAALTLSELHDSRVFPLLGKTAAGVADRTSRNKITLGGNICGLYFYREAVLPLLLTDSEVRITGPSGYRQTPIRDIFDQTLQLAKGELLVQVLTETKYLQLPYVSIKKRKVAEIDYPLVTVTALRADGRLRFAFSGVCDFPFRSDAMEAALNETGRSAEERIDLAVKRLPAPILNDIKGSAAYREHVLKTTILEAMADLGGIEHDGT